MNLVKQIKREISHTQTQNRLSGKIIPFEGKICIHGSILKIYRGYGTNPIDEDSTKQKKGYV
ncbi:hypothetical protein CRM93_11645 [Acetobacter fabarum]|nr:hypothetical protein CRM93_11645 [Acetobacter fabarum]